MYTHRRVRAISAEDRAILESWRTSNKTNYWRKAVVILGSFQKKSIIEMAAQVERGRATIQWWIDYYNRNGLDGILFIPPGANLAIKEKIRVKKDNLVKILHESPMLHGINRTSWRLVDLAAVYEKVYGERIGATTVASHLAQLGFNYSKSREILTSPDPLYREKLEHIKTILSGLKENEKFFSVDEYGHFSVKLRVGSSFTTERKVVPKRQKSKGWLIVTAALELSTNQVTHFYSRKKDTEEMVRLMELLLVNYQTQDKIYFSWDAASWHASKKLYKRIEEVNDESYRNQHHTPLVELAPLPASAQFLNVIESVFSGLAKAVIHNSDYGSLEECMTAIDRHFKERNEYFQKHPKRAGNFIWGNERVKPVFDETNNCRYHNMR